ncbi:hypothetical protein E2C01_008185 [Portunus trituberculatus]|uniref:Uncharacterized protein n=1 Tax=Portunus trituberculatus TaxID=210409 RepID=A0A5B7D248_PORTR|nr:hypothetical protein [Portunus trituberculatus]
MPSKTFSPPILTAMGVGMGGSGSDISTTEMEKESKVKGKLKSLFKSGPPNRSQRRQQRI